MNYNILPFKYFVDVVETQGFTSAAKRNFISQTAISNSVKNLEKQLGVKLVDRSTSHFFVTPAGEVLYHEAIKLIKDYQSFVDNLSNLKHSENQKRVIKIRYLRGFGYWATVLANDLKKIDPNMEVQLDTESFSDSITRLDSGDYDILISFSTAVSKIKNINSTPIGMANFCILANKDIFDKEGQVKTKTVAKKPLFLQKWTATDSNDVQQKIRIILKKMGISYSEVVYLDSFDSATANVELSKGLALYPREFSIPDFYPNVLKYIPKFPDLQYDVVAIHRKPEINQLLKDYLKYMSSTKKT
ncbi:hypothetical protein LPAF129_08480 [Ligilactobacillus pabuli]|uniref:HTH lysR-type domain-containing protein n=1 Tax=Ligilactobacillus pabuli TaxID=2886039 RepID=A0ABQ5JGM1_9LACO|nr:LysR family transcriptional regulator [Ligilactobacillus pabuli]GKS81162.1 hypothetical protein LPAF129_08480 [Ligilactobacillus pabuli]HIW89249.1 LysR family transcriptional regulator [Candidatus Ligilactobacillus excrementipullorum]